MTDFILDELRQLARDSRQPGSRLEACQSQIGFAAPADDEAMVERRHPETGLLVMRPQ